MPQFDYFSFYNQVTWFIFFLLIFYFLIVFVILPQISYMVKFRTKKFNSNNHNNNFINFEKNRIFCILDGIYNKICFHFRSTLFNKSSLYHAKENTQLNKVPFCHLSVKQKFHYFLTRTFLFFKKIF